MWKTKKHILIACLALAGIGAMLAYSICESSCSYLKGDLAGIDLKFLGIIYMAAVAGMAICRWDNAVRLLLSFGLGSEVFLVSFQIYEGVFCPFCLFFGACVILSFALNYESPGRSRDKLDKMAYVLGEIQIKGFGSVVRYPALLFAILGLGLMLLMFSGGATPSYAIESGPRYYGSGNVEVRVYTDYFCGPCRKLEPQIEEALAKLTKAGKIRLLFVDTPIHRHTSLYARYFQYSTQNGNIDSALLVRRALFEAASRNITTAGSLESVLRDKGIFVSKIETSPIFQVLSSLIKQDRINSTPTIVALAPSGKKKYEGTKDILLGIEDLKKAVSN